MPAPISFSAPAFAIEAVTQTAGDRLRITFTSAPQASSPASVTDALRLENYAISGPVAVSVAAIQTVTGDPDSIDLILTAPLQPATYALTVSNIFPGTNGVQTPGSPWSFTAIGYGSTDSVNGGATNDSAAAIIRKHLPKLFKGTAWNAIIAALAVGDAVNFDNAAKAFLQLFKSSASGLYLDRKSSDDGVIRPRDIGMSDALFRKLSIAITNNKLTQEALLEVLEVFYGTEAVKAYSETGLAAPFNLSDGDDLQVKLDERTSVPIIFTASDFLNISVATGIEVAASITRQLRLAKSQAIAVAYTDPQTLTTKVRIYSNARGLLSSVRITGGKAQNTLQFPALLAITSPNGTSWTVTIPRLGVTRFTVVGPPPDLSLLQVGDYVNIYDTAFSASNRGSFTVLNVGITYSGAIPTQFFDLAFTGSAQAVVQAATPGMLFFRPTRRTTLANLSRLVTVTQPTPTQVDVILPATSQAVGRGPLRAAYLPPTNILAPSSIVRRPDGTVYVTLANHGLSVGQQVLLDGAYGISTAPTTINGSVSTSGLVGTSDASLIDIWSGVRPQDGVTHPTWYAVSVLLGTGDVLYCGGNASTTANRSTAARFSVTGTSTLTGGETQISYNWITTASMNAARSYHAGLQVGDGRVVVLGGLGTLLANVLNSAETYSTVGNAWTTLGTTLVTGRAAHSVGLLLTGKVLISGGATTTTTGCTATCELYDPTVDTFASTGSMSKARCDHSLVVLSSGLAVAIGGRDVSQNGGTLLTAGSGLIHSSCEVYDPLATTWSPAGRMSYSRVGAAAVLLPDDQILVIGGYGQRGTTSDAPAVLASCEIWDSKSRSWRPAGQLAQARWNARAVYLAASNRVIVSGGDSTSTVGAAPLSTAEIYDVATGRWSKCIRSSVPRSGGSLTVLADGAVVAHGGQSSPTAAQDTPELFIPGSPVVARGGLNGLKSVASIVDANTFTFNTPKYKGYTSNVATTPGLMIAKASPAPTAVPGPFTFDPSSGAAVTSSASTLSAALFKGHSYAQLNVADATQFPDAPGYLVLAFGRSSQVFPVQYLGRISATALELDAGYVFPNDVPLNATVTLLSQKAPFEPHDAPERGAFYVTASPAGRVAASSTVDDIVAGGVTVTKKINYPGGRGLGNEGMPTGGSPKISDVVRVFASDVDAEVIAAEEGS